MDNQGKPQMSRELLERILKSGGNSSNSQTIGAQSQLSFDERKRIEKNRRLIASYRDSHLGAQSFRDEEASQIGDGDKYQKRSRRSSRLPAPESRQLGAKVDSGQNRPSAGFKEPPPRSYNPYS